MTLVFSKDDGIDAGIQALPNALTNYPNWVVALDQHLPGCGHHMNRGGAIARVGVQRQ